MAFFTAWPQASSWGGREPGLQGLKHQAGGWEQDAAELEAASAPGWLLTQETQGDISERRARARW